MDRLFVSLYLDEDVDVVIGEILRARGYDIVTTLEAKRLSATDEDQLVFASTEQRALVTHNRVDFEGLASEWFKANRSHAGIIIATRHEYSEIARRLMIVLDAVTADEMHDQLRYI